MLVIMHTFSNFELMNKMNVLCPYIKFEDFTYLNLNLELSNKDFYTRFSSSFKIQ